MAKGRWFNENDYRNKEAVPAVIPYSLGNKYKLGDYININIKSYKNGKKINKQLKVIGILNSNNCVLDNDRFCSGKMSTDYLIKQFGTIIVPSLCFNFDLFDFFEISDGRYVFLKENITDELKTEILEKLDALGDIKSIKEIIANTWYRRWPEIKELIIAFILVFFVSLAGIGGSNLLSKILNEE